jgi:hypothetical protein
VKGDVYLLYPVYILCPIMNGELNICMIYLATIFEIWSVMCILLTLYKPIINASCVYSHNECIQVYFTGTKLKYKT